MTKSIIICDKCGSDVTDSLNVMQITVTTVDIVKDHIGDFCNGCISEIIKQAFTTNYPRGNKSTKTQKNRKAKVDKKNLAAVDNPESEAVTAERIPRNTIDQGKVMALHNAGRSAAWIADDMRLNVSTVRTIIQRNKSKAELAAVRQDNPNGE